MWAFCQHALLRDFCTSLRVLALCFWQIVFIDLLDCEFWPDSGDGQMLNNPFWQLTKAIESRSRQQLVSLDTSILYIITMSVLRLLPMNLHVGVHYKFVLIPMVETVDSKNTVETRLPQRYKIPNSYSLFTHQSTRSMPSI